MVDPKYEFWFSEKHKKQNEELKLSPVYALVNLHGVVVEAEYTFCDEMKSSIYTEAYNHYWDDVRCVGYGIIKNKE